MLDDAAPNNEFSVAVVDHSVCYCTGQQLVFVVRARMSPWTKDKPLARIFSLDSGKHLTDHYGNIQSGQCVC